MEVDPSWAQGDPEYIFLSNFYQWRFVIQLQEWETRYMTDR